MWRLYYISGCAVVWATYGRVRSVPLLLSSGQYSEVAPFRFLAKNQVIFSPDGRFACNNKWHNAWGLCQANIIVSSREMLLKTRQRRRGHNVSFLLQPFLVVHLFSMKTKILLKKKKVGSNSRNRTWLLNSKTNEMTSSHVLFNISFLRDLWLSTGPVKYSLCEL